MFFSLCTSLILTLAGIALLHAQLYDFSSGNRNNVVFGCNNMSGNWVFRDAGGVPNPPAGADYLLTSEPMACLKTGSPLLLSPESRLQALLYLNYSRSWDVANMVLVHQTGHNVTSWVEVKGQGWHEVNEESPFDDNEDIGYYTLQIMSNSRDDSISLHSFEVITPPIENFTTPAP